MFLDLIIFTEYFLLLLAQAHHKVHNLPLQNFIQSTKLSSIITYSIEDQKMGNTQTADIIKKKIIYL